MNWWRYMSFIHEARLLVCFYCYGVWSAKTTLKVCDTSISMISFYKLTFLVLIVVSFHHLELCEIWWLLSQVQNFIKWKTINWNSEDKTNLSIFEQLWPYYYKYAEICKIKYALRLGSLMKMSNGRLKVLSTWFIFLERLENVN